MDGNTEQRLAHRIRKLAADRAQRKQSIAEHQKAIVKIDEELRHLIGSLGVPVEVKS